jgi:hypothetical protein
MDKVHPSFGGEGNTQMRWRFRVEKVQSIFIIIGNERVCATRVSNKIVGLFFTKYSPLMRLSSSLAFFSLNMKNLTCTGFCGSMEFYFFLTGHWNSM